MNEFWYGYMKPRCKENEKLYYMDTSSFIVYLNTKEISVDISKDVETRPDTSIMNYKDHCLKEKNKKSNWTNES